jgi:hypothetical protein
VRSTIVQQLHCWEANENSYFLSAFFISCASSSMPSLNSPVLLLAFENHPLASCFFSSFLSLASSSFSPAFCFASSRRWRVASDVSCAAPFSSWPAALASAFARSLTSPASLGRRA